MNMRTQTADAVQGGGGWIRIAALVLGPAMLAAALAVPAPAGLSPEGWRVASVLAWMVVWWCGDAVPAPVTALLPFVALPMLGVVAPEAAAKAQASPIIFLLLGGAVMALGAVKTGLHLRLARLAVGVGGGGPRRLLLAVMAAAAFAGMWVATSMATLFMVEIGVALALATAAANPDQDAETTVFARALIVGVAYAAMLGGFSTFSGNIFNAVAAGMITQQTGQRIGVLDWFTYGFPVAVLGVPMAWALIVAVGFRFRVRLPTRERLLQTLDAPNGWSLPQVAVAAIMVCILAAWLSMPTLKAVLPGISDAGVAVAGAFLMFLLPSGRGGRLLTWDDAARIPWGVLLIAGGALAIGAALTKTGVDVWLTAPLRQIHGVPVWLALLALAAGAALLTEVVNNIAMATITVPAAVALAAAVGAEPAPMAIAAVIASLGGFVVPGTPGLAIAVGTPPVRVPDLARAGLWMLLLMPLLIAFVAMGRV
jgi:sodium-dependent dicarboxylate transporter 2/3/5